MSDTTFKLFYDGFGKVLFYSCEDHPGSYIEIDSLTYAEGRFDIQVIDGQIKPLETASTVFKFVKSEKGTKCPIEDISIVASDEYEGEINYWNLKNV